MKNLFIFLIFMVCFTVIALSSEGNFGLGIIIGEPTGLSYKIWNGKTNAFDGAIAWSMEGNNKMHFHFDYLFHNYNLIKARSGKLPFYYGIGGRIRIIEESHKNDDNDFGVGVRIPLGLSFIFRDAPLDLFMEFVPILDLVPSTEFDVNAGIGIRYYF